MQRDFLYPYPVQEEEWLEIRDHSDYLISSWGRVYSCIYDIFLELWPSPLGYLQVCLTPTSEACQLNWHDVHRLVAEHFIPGEDYGLDVRHLDGDILYNNERNLEWVAKGAIFQTCLSNLDRISKKQLMS